MNTFKFQIQYKGTRYLGWQIQPMGLTVQGELNKALSKITKSEDIRTIGSGRTDRGVHAFSQFVKAIIPLDIGTEELKRGLNSLLPDDIQVLAIESVSPDFHPIGNSEWKEYVYLFSTSRELSLFHKDYVAIYPYELDFDKMQEACLAFVGTHDFADFQCVGTEVDSTNRKIIECELSPYHNEWGIFPKSDEIYMLRVKGEGFLKQMVRLMMGTVWSVGQSRVDLEQLKASLATPKGEKLGSVAPAQGLYLNQVFYP